ncbi:hypothetical protein NPIL_363631 [Nephila pilipes]|uniref:Uncharacterized protein n=1 Tax=Nephila pilipes TaxID=299642 RepID=A0A8X6MI75_NEPPI|nr:hypothetical protein NPIL_363631 [Nephila pilipes]
MTPRQLCASSHWILIKFFVDVENQTDAIHSIDNLIQGHRLISESHQWLQYIAEMGLRHCDICRGDLCRAFNHPTVVQPVPQLGSNQESAHVLRDDK